MADSRCLLDTNILLRWIKPNDRDYGVHGVKRILSFNNTDFARYRDIEAVHPRTLSAKHP